MGDSEARFRCPHGTALRGERRMVGPDLACDPSDICVGASAALLRTAAQRRQGPGSSDGRFVTLRVSIGWPSESGRYAADSPRQSRSCAALRNACRCDDVAATRSGVRALGMGVARLAGCDSLARKRPAKRTKARIPPECSSSSIATGRRERPPRQAAHSPPLSGNSGWYR